MASTMRSFGDSGADVATTNESNTFTFGVDVPLTILRAAQAIANYGRNLLTPTAQEYSDTSTKRRKRSQNDEQGSEDIRPLVRQHLRLEQIISAPPPSLTEDQLQGAFRNPSRIQELLADEAILSQYQAEVINIRASQALAKLVNLQMFLRQTAEARFGGDARVGCVEESDGTWMEPIQGAEKTLMDLEPRVGYSDEMQQQTQRRRAIIETVIRNLISVAEAHAAASASPL
ncbi:hypothetical protein CVT26_012209 [Gymnopilus dilepis]|uniref:Uncharacterized protein n=1 Tax=Gymnopilus dilepis TaxID=231916 RepID=A0A409YQ42_9AGAR|nr:hypothetical protein CVT26_012209 [Gymnopilus dilepis]